MKSSTKTANYGYSKEEMVQLRAAILKDIAKISDVAVKPSAEQTVHLIEKNKAVHDKDRIKKKCGIGIPISKHPSPLCT